jgi:hypothetical protein
MISELLRLAAAAGGRLASIHRGAPGVAVIGLWAGLVGWSAVFGGDGGRLERLGRLRGDAFGMFAGSD